MKCVWSAIDDIRFSGAGAWPWVRSRFRAMLVVLLAPCSAVAAETTVWWSANQLPELALPDRIESWDKRLQSFAEEWEEHRVAVSAAASNPERVFHELGMIESQVDLLGELVSELAAIDAALLQAESGLPISRLTQVQPSSAWFAGTARLLRVGSASGADPIHLVFASLGGDSGDPRYIALATRLRRQLRARRSDVRSLGHQLRSMSHALRDTAGRVGINPSPVPENALQVRRN